MSLRPLILLAVLSLASVAGGCVEVTLIDNECAADEAAIWYLDADGDGWGVTDVFEVDCTAPEGFVDIDGDCDDTDADINPDGLEECDGLDTDCDGEAGTDQIRQFRGTVRARGTRVPITASGDRSVGWVASLSGRWAAPGRQRVRLPARASREPRQGPVQGGSRVA